MVLMEMKVLPSFSGFGRLEFQSFSIEEESIERPQSLPLPSSTTPQINEIEAE